MASRNTRAQMIGAVIVLACIVALATLSWSAMKVSRWAEACGKYPPEIECPLDPDGF